MDMKSVKVNFRGETKRFKVSPNNYEALVEASVQAFGAMPKNIKFFYLDEDQETISVSSGQDLAEAFESDLKGILKLVVASNSQEASQVLMEAEVSSAHMSSFSNIQRSEINQPAQPLARAASVLAESNIEMAEELEPPATARVEHSKTMKPKVDFMIIDTCNSEAQPEEPKPVESQPEEAKPDDEMIDVHQAIAEFSEEFTKTWKSDFRDLLIEYLQTKKFEQEEIVHEGIVCDGCQVSPIKGIRFKCSVCADYDICQVCEAKGYHSEHPLLKIRKPQQAPVKFMCQYGPKGGQANPLSGLAKEGMGLIQQFMSHLPAHMKPSQPKRRWGCRRGEQAQPASQPAAQPTPEISMAEPNLIEKQLSDVEERLAQFKSQVNDDDLYDDEPVEQLVDKTANMHIDENEEVKVEPAMLSNPYPKAEERQTEQFPLTTQTTLATSCTEDVSAFEQPKPAPMTYEEKVNSKQLPEKTREDMLTLGRLGFESLETNLVLLNKYKDIQLVANTLLSGALNESAINEIYMK